MALTRKLLKSFGLEDEKIDSIIEAHGETVDGLKQKLEKAEAEAAKVEELTKQLNEANDKLAKSGDAAKVQAAFDAFKDEVTKEKARERKKAAIDTLLKDAGVVRESFRTLILKNIDLEKVETDETGGVKDAEAFKKSVATDYADFISTTTTGGTPTVNPPAGSGKYTSRADIMKIKDTAERQKAIAENLDLFKKN